MPQPRFRVRCSSPSEVAWRLDMLHVIDGDSVYLPLGSFDTWRDAIEHATTVQGSPVTEVAL